MIPASVIARAESPPRATTRPVKGLRHQIEDRADHTLLCRIILINVVPLFVVFSFFPLVECALIRSLSFILQIRGESGKKKSKHRRCGN
jgi:hypothetical protein